MSNREFKVMVSRSGFLMDWQKDRLTAMLDNGGLEEGEDGDGLPPRRDATFRVLDNVLWRTMGVGLSSLSPMDRIGIEQAVREVT